MDPSSPDYIPGMENYNTVSGGGLNMLTGGRLGDETTYGLQDAYQKRIDTIENTLAKKYSDGDYSGTELDERLADLKAAKAEEATLLNRYEGDINPEGTGDGSIAEKIALQDIIDQADDKEDDMLVDTPTDIVDVQAVKDNIKKAEESTITNDITSNQIDEFNIDAVEDYDFSDFDDGDTSVAADTPAGSEPIGSFFDAVDNAAAEAAAAQAASAAQAAANQESYKGGGDGGGGGDNVTDSKSGDTYSGEAYGYNEAAEKGNDSGGGGNGGGKIVCTMMNESYGFGLFRNKIWMKFHKNIAPEYQKGYHKIFLPLVKLSKTNKIVKKVLEHIAVHSTIDMRQATRGKTHLLGRVYRKIILPLCYWAGKND